jgi:hypothetical protein
MTFITKDATRQFLIRLGLPSSVLSIALHLLIPNEKREHPLAVPPEHAPHQEYPVMPPSLDLRVGSGSTNTSDDFPIGGHINSNDVVIQRWWHEARAQHQRHVAQISSTLYMST